MIIYWREEAMPTTKTIKPRLLMQAALSSIHDVQEAIFRGEPCLDIIGVCRLDHSIVRRIVMKSGEVWQWEQDELAFFPLNMVRQGHVRREGRRAG